MGEELTASEVEAWHRDGFLIVRSFVDQQTVSELGAAYDELLRAEGSAPPVDYMLGGITREINFPSAAHPVFRENVAVTRGLALARRLLGTESVARTYDMLIYKPPGHPYETPWHQDWAYSRQPFAEAGATDPPESIQFWVPLDDVDVETGCMQFVPGCHEARLLEHAVASGDPTAESRLLALTHPHEQVDLSTVVVAEIPAGGATLHAPGTPHFTGPNRSSTRQRRSYVFNIAPRPADADTPS